MPYVRDMRLTSLHVRNFRNVLDSTLTGVDDHVTCLVGKNEAGKSTILHALWRLNPHQPVTFDITQDYPRWKVTADKRAATVNDVAPIVATFALDRSDLEAVAAVVGPGVVGDTVTFSRWYDDELIVEVEVDEAAALATILEGVELPKAAKTELTKAETLAELATAAQTMRTSTGDDTVPVKLVDGAKIIEARIASIKTEGPGVGEAVEAVLTKRLPKFFYFSDYQMLPGRVDLAAVEGGVEPPATSPNQTIRALLRLAQTDAAALRAADYETRQAELEAVGEDLTQQIQAFWTQNPELSVVFAIDKVPGATPQGQSIVAHYLDIRVRDGRHGAFTNNFGQRSSGFRWFFSFLAAFSEFENDPAGVIVLLDEPALQLHGRAQADFLGFIERRLAAKCQVVYTTHSPFMVDVGALDRVRVVEDKGKEAGAVVSAEVLSVDQDTLFPLQGALGYEIAQSLFIGPNNLLVEGTSDFTYLTVMSDHLRSLGRHALDERWRVLAAGSAANVPAFVALLGKGLDVTVLVDAGPGLQRLHALVGQGLLADGRLLTIGGVLGLKSADIEDVFTVADYLGLYNAAFGSHLSEPELAPGDRVVDRISRTAGAEFKNHGLPADWLLRNRAEALGTLSPGTLDRFETLFEAIDATID